MLGAFDNRKNGYRFHRASLFLTVKCRPSKQFAHSFTGSSAPTGDMGNTWAGAARRLFRNKRTHDGRP
jgi:hypothetical protein